jgi:uncharacterized protein YhbP (UPF0306 family)
MGNNIRELIKEVLSEGYLMSLGTVDDGGVWVADVIYIFDDNLNIYWMSKLFRRHSKAIEQNSHVAGTITVSGQGEDNLGIQFEGMVNKIEGERYDLAKKHYAKRKKPEPKETDDVLDGGSWYQLKPVKMELIHEKLFGFEKQKLEL